MHSLPRLRTLVATLGLAAAGVAQDKPPLPARIVGDCYEVGETRVFQMTLDGKPLGFHWSTYRGQGDTPGIEGHRFESQVELLKGPLTSNVSQRFHLNLWTDDQGLPRRLVLRSTVGQMYAALTVDFTEPDNGQVPVHLVQGPSERDLEVPYPAGAHILGNNFISHLELALLTRGLDSNKNHLQMFSANSLQSFPLTVGRESDDAPTWHDSLGEVIRLDDEGKIQRLEIPAQKVVIELTEEEITPFTLSPPATRRKARNFDSREVVIEAGPVRIAGVVTKPKNSSSRLPAVFFISGSGMQDRDGVASGIDIGTHEILDRLTEEGFLVLRVDDRAAGQSKGPTANLTFDDLVGDARACVSFLKEQDDVDPARIALIGHSEGGETAPILAAEMPDLAAIVLLAGPGRSVIDIISEQVRGALEDSDMSPEEVEQSCIQHRAALQRVCSDEPVTSADLPEEFRGLLTVRPWLQSHFRQDPLANIKQVGCPVLILQGAKDFQVSAERDARPLEQALEDVDHSDHELHVFEGLDHLFKKAPGEESSIDDYFRDRPVDAEFLDLLSAWLKVRLAAKQ